MRDDDELTPKQAAAMLKISTPTLRRYEDRGLIKPRRMPSTDPGNPRAAGHRRYRYGDVEALRKKLFDNPENDNGPSTS